MTFSSFSALFLAPKPPSEGPARTSVDSARTRPHLSTLTKQRGKQPRRRIIHGIASLPDDLVRLLRLFRTFLQRTNPVSAPGHHPKQALHASSTAFSTPPRPTAVTFSSFSSFCALLFAATPPSRSSARTSLGSAEDNPNLSTFSKQRDRPSCRPSRIIHAACRNPANRRKWMP